jgi:hypothetical protein
MRRKYSPCAGKMVKASGGKMTLDEAEDILKNIKYAQEKLESKGYASGDAVSEAVKEHFDKAEYYRQKEKLNGYKNIKIKAETTLFLQGLIDKGLSVNEAKFSFMHGINSPIENTRHSLDLKKDVVTAGYAGKFISTLEKEGLLPILQSEKFNNDIIKDLWELSYDRKPISTHKEVNRIAEIIYETQENMRKRLNKAGADIGNMQGFVVSQTHDIDLMKKASKQKWIDFVKDKIDMERSFGGGVDASNIDKALNSAYEALITGVRLSVETGDDNVKLFQFSNASNRSKSISQPRQIIFKDANDFIAYKNQFSRNTLNESIAESIRTNSQDIALLENLGTNPQAMLETVFRKIDETNREKLINKPKTDIWDITVKSGINNLLGIRGDNYKLSNYANSIKNFNIFTMLGRSLFTQVPDLQFKASEYQFQGRTFLSSWGATLNDVMNGFKSDKDKKHFASMVGVYAENFLADLNVKVSTGKSYHKKINRLTQLFMKLNLQEPWDKANKTSMSRTLSHDLALMSDTNYNNLSADTKRIFGYYGINENDWDIIRKNRTTLEDGRDYITADGLLDNKTAEKLTAYFIDRVNFATNSPTGSTRSRIAFGTQKGTPSGELLNLIMQFKTFMFSMFEKSYGRDAYAKGKADKLAIVQTILMTTALAYIGGTIKDILSNKTPKDPTNPAVFLESLVRGGGLSIAGDLLFADTSGFNSITPTKYFSGPTFGRIDDVYSLYSSLKTGRDARAEALRIGTQAIPFNNLFYIREPINELFLYSIQEHLNPGYLQRIDKRNKERYNQQQIFDTR